MPTPCMLRGGGGCSGCGYGGGSGGVVVVVVVVVGGGGIGFWQLSAKVINKKNELAKKRDRRLGTGRIQLKKNTRNYGL